MSPCNFTEYDISKGNSYNLAFSPIITTTFYGIKNRKKERRRWFMSLGHLVLVG